MSGQHSGTDRVLSHGRSSVRPRFVEPIVAKQGNLFLLSGHDGDIQDCSEQGLYFHDMRYLCAETLRLNGMPLVSLLASSSKGSEALFDLTNPDITDNQGHVQIRKETLGIHRSKRLHEECVETITVENFATETSKIVLSMTFKSDFVSIFEVRGTAPGKRGTIHDPQWNSSEDQLVLRYDGADGHTRTTTLHFSQAPTHCDGGQLEYHFALDDHQRWELRIGIRLRDEGGALDSKPSAAESVHSNQLRWAHEGVSGKGMGIQTSNTLFNQVLGRSFQDLHMLSMRQQGDAFFAAGVPWYVALFGRDSLITGIEMAAYEPEIAEQTLQVLASHQGTKIDDWRDEQPGKVPHELRVGEMANLDEIPQTPYYGSVDSTPLFLILLGVHASWVGTLDLFHELRDPVRAALDWIDDYGDSDGDGFIDYKTRSKSGLRNQGWKDSGNGVVMQDGSLAVPPIAMPEVQGDVYLAWSMMADLFERDGDGDTAKDLREKARTLYEAFNREFWLPDEQYYAFCRQADGHFSKSIASNPAHALWTGIVDRERASAVVERAMKEDMFSGWGIRTLSSEDVSYNPVDYQVGSIWPHDNAIIVAGMQRYGQTTAALRVFSAIMDAASKFRHFRLPETFAGYARDHSDDPVRYPVACNPQAWAAGAIPYMVQVILGLQPDAYNRHLRIEHPALPDWLDWVAIHELKVGNDSVDLRYERSGRATLVAIEKKSEGLNVEVAY